MNKTIKFARLQELQSGDDQIKVSEGLLENIPICGLISKNKRRYKESAIRDAIALYEGSMVNINHGAGARDAESRFGKAENLKFDGKLLRGNIRFLESHPMAARIKEDIARGTDCFGCSHIIDGEGYRDTDGTQVIEKITAVESIDIVAGAATVKSLREQTEKITEEMGAEVGGEGTHHYYADGVHHHHFSGGEHFLHHSGGTMHHDTECSEQASEQVKQLVSEYKPGDIEKIIEQRVQEAITKLSKNTYVKPRSGRITEQHDGDNIPADPEKRKAWYAAH